MGNRNAGKSCDRNWSKDFEHLFVTPTIHTLYLNTLTLLSALCKTMENIKFQVDVERKVALQRSCLG